MSTYQKRIKPLALTAVVTVMLILSSIWASAQGNPPPQGNGGGSTSGPVDGGALVFLISTAAYGYRKVKNRKAISKSEETIEATSKESV